ncbi:MAG: hypothetical protein ERJ67_06110 [Aphanocapsa feldmannii 277cV]|uniref:Uncharacterized protein n=1 Tax=Aphanocapsa feldmannii 277cV TaxID=2507553 RepID=A0A524RN68_9CHRO|nr:MAG: hypothetical protein ERJ69_08795 [Aphanocapsa feldmannii 288cV]TGG92230.1 MAG: hypothetical protein ERJ67_06110 [Aphanocapsa feldmannii 277cV]
MSESTWWMAQQDVLLSAESQPIAAVAGSETDAPMATICDAADHHADTPAAGYTPLQREALQLAESYGLDLNGEELDELCWLMEDMGRDEAMAQCAYSRARLQWDPAADLPQQSSPG